MATVAALQSTKLQIMAKLAFYTRESLFMSRKVESITDAVARATATETKWCNAYDKAMEAKNDIKIGNTTYVYKDDINNECAAIQYANAVVKNYDEDMVSELTEEQTDFEQQLAGFDAQMKLLESEKENISNLLGTNINQNPGIGGGK